MIPIVYSTDYGKYYFGPDHPFSPLRLTMLISLLRALQCFPEPIKPPIASREEILRVHSEDYVLEVEKASAGRAYASARQFGLNTPDVPIFAGMDEAARRLAGGTLHAGRLVAEGSTKRVLQLGGGLHHAHFGLASGFCVYNDLSVAIADLRARGYRVAYIDVDVHHGDGVQQLHYADPGVLTISLHESGQYLFPGTGHIHELGEGPGKGYKLNVPLEPFTGDDSYQECFERVVPHVLAWFQPDILLIQCGADAHFDDPLAELHVTTRGYGAIFRRLLEYADTYSEGRAVFTLGGGYNLDATVRIWAILYLILCDRPVPESLPEEWVAEWEKVLGKPLTSTLHDRVFPAPVERAATIDNQNRLTSRRLLEMAAPHWY